jgi:hypothetical protein
MNIATLTEVQGSSIQEAKGTVLKLWPRKTGVGRDGSGSMQNGTLKLECGENIEITFWDYADMKHLVNKKVTFRSKKGDRGLSGVKVGEFKGKIKLEITGSAEIEQESSSSAEEPSNAQPSSSRPTSTPNQHPGQSSAGSNYSLADLVNLYNHIYTIVYEGSAPEERTDREHIRGITTTLFISARQEGIKV